MSQDQLEKVSFIVKNLLESVCLFSIFRAWNILNTIADLWLGQSWSNYHFSQHHSFIVFMTSWENSGCKKTCCHFYKPKMAYQLSRLRRYILGIWLFVLFFSGLTEFPCPRFLVISDMTNKEWKLLGLCISLYRHLSECEATIASDRSGNKIHRETSEIIMLRFDLQEKNELWRIVTVLLQNTSPFSRQPKGVLQMYMIWGEGTHTSKTLPFQFYNTECHPGSVGMTPNLSYMYLVILVAFINPSDKKQELSV